jgi:hypothetical protein
MHHHPNKPPGQSVAPILSSHLATSLAADKENHHHHHHHHHHHQHLLNSLESHEPIMFGGLPPVQPPTLPPGIEKVEDDEVIIIIESY